MAGRGSKVALVLPVLLVELVLAVGVYGGPRALHQRDVLAHGRLVTATVTDTARHCKGSDCTFDSTGSYTVAGTTQRDVLLRCCAARPLTGAVPVRVDPASPRDPVPVGTDLGHALPVALAAAVLLVAGNAFLVVLLLRRRRSARAV